MIRGPRSVRRSRNPFWIAQNAVLKRCALCVLIEGVPRASGEAFRIITFGNLSIFVLVCLENVVGARVLRGRRGLGTMFYDVPGLCSRGIVDPVKKSHV